jgi:glycyl-tRNA synthetase
LAILPLTKKDGLPEIGRDIFNKNKHLFKCFYEEKDTIGKRYRRMDALGTPFCITIDHQSKEDQTVTIRYRDSMEQVRVSIDEIGNIVEKQIS